ncbi:MAG: PAS domain-containing protein [Ginsengibacter sp.]
MKNLDLKNASAYTYQFLSGGGEMGALTRAKDWSKTSIGPVADWPQSLRTTLSIILNSRFPMFLFWGPQLICFYNDAFRPSLGHNGKHPDILGMNGEDAWPEIWEIINPLIDQVLSGGEATWSEDQLIPIYRNGKIEDVYWTFSYSPVNDESGKPAGVFVTCSETTGKVKMLEEIGESKNQLQFAIDATGLGTWDYNPVINKFTGNERLREWFGLKPQDEIDLSIAVNVVAQADKVRVTDAIQKALQFSSGGYYDIDYTIINPVTKKERIVRAKGKAEFNDQNVAYRFNGTLQDITSRALAKRKTEAREKQFRNLVLQSPVPMAIFMGEEHIIELANNNMIEKIWRKKESDVIGKKLLDVFPELRDQKYPELLHKIFVSGKSYRENESIAYIQEDTKLIKYYLDVEYAPLIEIDNTVSGIIVTVNNVTEKVEARRTVEDAEERLRLAVQAAELATWELDLKNRNIIYSSRLPEIFGHDSNYNFTHAHMRSQIHPDDIHDIVEKAFDVAMETGVYKYEARVVKPDNSVSWISTRGKVFFGENNEPVKMIGTLRDITEEKTYHKELEEREQKFRLLADSMPQHVWTADTEGNLNYFNKSVFDYSGLTPEQINKDGWIQIVHPDDREENIKEWTHAISTGNSFLFEHRFRRNDGEYRWQLSRAVPQKDANGNIQMWVGTSTDIQDIKEVDQQKDFFMSMASHELKTPITSIKGYVQILQSMYVDAKDDFLTTSLKTIDKQIITLTNLISDLLDLSKIKSGNLFLTKQNFYINGLIREIVGEIKHINPSYNIDFTEESDALVHADRERIGQVLINFLTNAVKYSPNTKDVLVKAVVEDNKVAVFVKDSGIGINKPDQARIFERFYRVEGKNEKTFPGFGIGLFICAQIIERHSGSIGVTSEPGKGSAFSFLLPVQNES